MCISALEHLKRRFRQGRGKTQKYFKPWFNFALFYEIPPMLKWAAHLPVRYWVAGPVSGLLMTGRSFDPGDCSTACFWEAHPEARDFINVCHSLCHVSSGVLPQNQKLPVTQWNIMLSPFALKQVLSIWNSLKSTLRLGANLTELVPCSWWWQRWLFLPCVEVRVCREYLAEAPGICISDFRTVAFCRPNEDSSFKRIY